MKRGPFLVAVGLLSVLLALCAAVFAYDVLAPKIGERLYVRPRKLRVFVGAD